MADTKQLAQAVQEADEDVDTVHGEVKKLLRELSSDGRLAEQFAEGVERGDREELERVIGGAGMSDEVEVRSITVHGKGSVDIDTCRRKQRVICIKIQFAWEF